MSDKPSCQDPEQRIPQSEAGKAGWPLMQRALEQLFNLSPDLLCVADFDGYFRMVNAAFENVLGYSRNELLKVKFIELVHPGDRVATLEAMKQLTLGKTVSNFENRYRCADGSYRWLSWNSVPVLEERFEYAVARDVTAQKAIQRQLQSQRDLFDQVLSNVPASIFWKDRNSVYLGVNQRFLDDAGLQHPEEIIGKTDYDLVWSREEADFYRDCDRKVMEAGEPMLNIEESQQQADGKRVDLLTNKVPLRDAAGRVNGMLGIYMDISKLKQTESTLRKSQSRLQTLFDSAPEFIFVIDPEGEIIKANRYVYEHSGYQPDEVIGENIKTFLTRESKEICDCNFPGLRERGYNTAHVDFVCKDGRIIQMECSATAVADEYGDFTTFLIIQRDVTERNRAAAALADSERRFRAIFNSAFQFNGLLDPEGTVLEANQTVLEFLGYQKNDLVGKPFWEVMSRHGSVEQENRTRAAVEQARDGTLVRYQADIVGKDGVVRTVDISLKPVRDERGETVLIIPEGRDITDLRQAEENLRSHQQEMAHVMRLSTMGEMASGIAHELNQPLTALLSYCGSALTLANSLASPSQGISDLLERATEQAHRAAKIIRHLREFIGKDAGNMKPVDVDQTIKDLNTLLNWELKSTGVRLECHLDSGGRKVWANKVQIEQVLVNLVRNGVEAIQTTAAAGGVISLTTGLRGDDFIEVTVADSGPGVDTDMIENMFDPFHTSKVSGMGMGLPISRTIIENHGGKLWMDRNYKSGALFAFKLPVSD